MRRPSPPTTPAAAVLAVLSALTWGCSDPCCEIDGRDISLSRTTAGALLVPARLGGSAVQGTVLVDTASPITVWHEPQPHQPPRARRNDLALYAADAPEALRARFGQVLGVAAPLGPLGEAQPSPLAVLGGEFLRNFAVTFDGPNARLQFWDDMPASSTFLSANGYAVLRVDARGGGQLDAEGEPDLLDQRGPYQFPASQLVLRACAEPDVNGGSLPATCCAGDDLRLATGVDLALVLGTGYGPLVLAESAWRKLRAARPDLPDATSSGPLHHPNFATPVPARFAQISRIAFVDRESNENDNPGPCVELGRARRIEVVAAAQAAPSTQPPATAPCVQPCDQDPRARPRARNSAGYVEIGGAIDVAVVPDESDILQSLRLEIHPEGPVIDGIAGAGVFAGVNLEIDYPSQPVRAIFSCPSGAAPQTCRAIGRCPRLPRVGDTRLCFGLPEHSLPVTCETPPAACP